MRSNQTDFEKEIFNERQENEPLVHPLDYTNREYIQRLKYFFWSGRWPFNWSVSDHNINKILCALNKHTDIVYSIWLILNNNLIILQKQILDRVLIHEVYFTFVWCAYKCQTFTKHVRSEYHSDGIEYRYTRESGSNTHTRGKPKCMHSYKAISSIILLFILKLTVLIKHWYLLPEAEMFIMNHLCAKLQMKGRCH